MKIQTMEDLFLEVIRDLYDAEKQIVKALPKMIKAASSEELKEGFEEHLSQTQVQIQRLEKIFSNLGTTAGRSKCAGMQGLLAEGEDLIASTEPSAVRDAGIIAAAQKVEHYEMAGYGSARTFAQVLGHTDAVALLEQTLVEEKETDQKLTEIAEELVNEDAVERAGSAGSN